jgi:hypothetical protein
MTGVSSTDVSLFAWLPRLDPGGDAQLRHISSTNGEIIRLKCPRSERLVKDFGA